MMIRTLRFGLAWSALALTMAACTLPALKSEQDFPQQPGQETTATTRARIHTELGAGYYARGQFDVALEELNGALKDDPGYSPAFGMLGLVYAALREDAKAEANFLRSIQLNSQDPDVRNNFGWFLCERGREVQAIGQFDLAVQNPFYRTPDVALVNAGRCTAKLGDRKRAEAYYERAAAAVPTNGQALYALVELAYRGGDFALARTRMRTLTTYSVPGPDALLLGSCIERKLDDKRGTDLYVEQLSQRFPGSREFRLADGGACP
jgi:type IV pilus assembly protein PilF